MEAPGVRGSRSLRSWRGSAERAHEVVEVEVAVGEVLRRDDGVEVVLVRAAGDGRVAELGVEGVVAEQQGDLAREALGLVNGPGVAVLQVVGDVVEWEPTPRGRRRSGCGCRCSSAPVIVPRSPLRMPRS